MAQGRINLEFRVKHWFTHHPWLKLIALVLSVMLWFYVSAQISTSLNF